MCDIGREREREGEVLFLVLKIEDQEPRNAGFPFMSIKAQIFFPIEP